MKLTSQEVDYLLTGKEVCECAGLTHHNLEQGLEHKTLPSENYTWDIFTINSIDLDTLEYKVGNVYDVLKDRVDEQKLNEFVANVRALDGLAERTELKKQPPQDPFLMELISCMPPEMQSEIQPLVPSTDYIPPPKKRNMIPIQPLQWQTFLTSKPSENLYDFCLTLITHNYRERGIDIYADGVSDLIKMDCVGLALFVIDGIEVGELNTIGELEYSQQLRGCYNRLLSMDEVANNHALHDDVQFPIHCEYLQALNNFNDVKLEIYGKIKPFETAKWITNYSKGKEFCPPSLVQFFENEKQSQPPQATTQPQEESPPKRMGKRQAVTIKEMAGYCDVSVSTIKNWDKGKGKPQGYPGRSDRTAAIIWSDAYKQLQSMKPESKALKNASTGHDIDKYSKGYYDQ